MSFLFPFIMEVFGMATEQEIEEVIKMLDDKTSEGVSRIGVHRVETEREDFVRDVHHHGRCDIGSPFADGSVGNFCDKSDD